MAVGSETRYGYPRHEEESVGLYYYHARYYDPDLGRFLQGDTVLDGLNRYAYVHNNPVRYTDPTGTDVGNAGNDGYYKNDPNQPIKITVVDTPAGTAMVQTGGNATNTAQTTALTSNPVPTTVTIVIVEGTVGHVVTVASPTVATGDAGGTAAATTGALALGEGAGAFGAGLVIPPLAAAYVLRQLFFDEYWQIRPEAQEFVDSVINLASGDAGMPGVDDPNPGRNPAQDRKASDAEIRDLAGRGYDAEDEKGYEAGADLYVDKRGNVYVKVKGEGGYGQWTGINIHGEH
jgi:RHS repeat-associated protein